ncbi:hypothetical protein BsWGS_03735 [Bradybaena similaris]
MSNNSTIENNSSQLMDYTSVYKNYFVAIITVNSTVAFAGTLINMWFLAALLLSPEIRARIRNKIICGMLVFHLIETVILCPFYIIHAGAYFLGTFGSVDCSFFTIHYNLDHIQDFVNNWYLLILLCVYIAQVMNFEPKFTSLWIKILTVAVFVTPCVFAVLFVPLTMKSFYLRYFDHRCFVTTWAAVKVFTSLDTAVPLTLSGLLLVVTAVLKYRRYPQGHSSDTLREQLIDAGSQIDPLHPFTAIFATAVASDFFTMFFFLNSRLFFGLKTKSWIDVNIVFATLPYLRVIFVPVMLLFFRDIREQIKIWRPCRRSTLRADLVVTYQKNTS